MDAVITESFLKICDRLQCTSTWHGQGDKRLIWTSEELHRYEPIIDVLPCHKLHRSLYTTQQGRRKEFAVGGQKRGSGDGSPPVGSRGKAPVGVWRQSPQKLETLAEYLTEQSHRSSQIAYWSESDYTLKKFQATTGDMHPCRPLGYATVAQVTKSVVKCWRKLECNLLLICICAVSQMFKIIFNQRCRTV